MAIDRVTGPDLVTRTQPGIENRRVEGQKSTDTPAFYLPEQEDNGGVIYEPSKPKEAEKTLAQKRQETAREVTNTREGIHSVFDGPGVEVSLSTAAVRAAEAAKPKTIGEIIADTLNSIKAFFVRLWTGEDDAAGALSAEEENTENAETEIISPIDAPKEAEKAVFETVNLRNNPETIAEFMVDYGGRHLVKNSDLLTQYDRNGRITSPNASDRRRILQGDGKIRRY